MRGLYFFGFLSAFAVGVVLALCGRITLAGSALLLMIVAAGCGLLVHARTSTIWCAALIILSGFGLGALRASYDVYQQLSYLSDPRIGTTVTISGFIDTQPIMGETTQKITMRTAQGRIIMFAPLYPPLSYGESIEVTGMLRRPDSFMTDTGRTFNYGAYLAKDEIFFVLDKPVITRTGTWRGNRLTRGLLAVRQYFIGGIERAVPEPYAGFASGVVLGVQNALSKEDEATFRSAGLIHVVVVSGYNITLVGDIVARMLSFASPLIASAGSLAGIIAFTMMTGASATAIRASIMAVLVLLARLTKRGYNMQRALFFAGFVMIMHEPYILLHDPSFQLSFLATWGLGTLTPYTQRLFAWVSPSALRDIAATTLATQAAVAPLLLYMSGHINVFALPANILVLPLMPLFMTATMVVGICAMFPSILILPASFLVQGVGAYVFMIARIFGLPMH